MVDEEKEFTRVPFSDDWFENEDQLSTFVQGCDIMVHLAARNRPADAPIVYETNVGLTRQLIKALRQNTRPPALIFTTSIREGENTAYGQSKQACREILESWAGEQKSNQLTTLQLPNIFGPGAKPFDNSFIATFSTQLIQGISPIVTENREIPLLYIDSACQVILLAVRRLLDPEAKNIGSGQVQPDFRMTVAEVLETLRGFWQEYQKSGRIAIPERPGPALLRKTFLSYL